MNFLQAKCLLGAVLWGALGCTVVPQSALATASTPYLGEINWVAFNYAPRNWAFCNGQLLPINQNAALFSLLGTTFGGNGVTTFALPDLRGRAPVHTNGSTVGLGQMAGEEAHTLTVSEIPAHTHAVSVDPKEATLATPGVTTYLAKTSAGTSAYAATPTTTLAPAAVSSVGGSQAHSNVKPFVTLNCIIALQGIYPSRN